MSVESLCISSFVRPHDDSAEAAVGDLLSTFNPKLESHAFEGLDTIWTLKKGITRFTKALSSISL